MAEEGSVLMVVAGVALDPITRSPIVVLRDEEGKLYLPIWVGLLEATAIASQLEGVKPERPLTQDLLLSSVDALGATLEAVEVCRLEEGTFFAELRLRRGEERLVLDARPSDAIALALRTKAPIFVEDAVIDNAKTVNVTSDKNDAERLHKWLESLDPDDLGRYKM